MCTSLALGRRSSDLSRDTSFFVLVFLVLFSVYRGCFLLFGTLSHESVWLTTTYWPVVWPYPWLYMSACVRESTQTDLHTH